MGDQRSHRPVGFRFRPTQQELIYLLQLKAQDVDISTVTSSVLEKDLYGAGKEPWRVFSDVDDDKWEIYDDSGKNDTKSVLYVITKLSKMSAKKIARTAGCGTWDGQTKAKIVKNYEGDKDMGSMKCLIYVLDSGCESEGFGKGYYYMHEYSLSKDSLREARIGSTDYVICRIVKDDSKCSNAKTVNLGGKKIATKTGKVVASKDQQQVGESSVINDQNFITDSVFPQQDYYGIDSGVDGSIMAQQQDQNSYNPTNIYCAPIEENMYCGDQPVEEIYCGNQQVMGMYPGVEEMYCGGNQQVMGTYSAVEEMNFSGNQQVMGMYPGHEEIYCGGNQQVMGMYSGVEEMNFSGNQQVTGIYPGVEEMNYCEGNQLVMGTYSGVEEMNSSNQQIMGTFPGVKEMNYCEGNQQVMGMYSGVEEMNCSGNQQVMASYSGVGEMYCCNQQVEDRQVIAIDEEKNMQQAKENIVDSSTAGGSNAAAKADDLMDMEQYISPSFLSLLQVDDLGLSPRFSEEALLAAERSWESYFVSPEGIA